MFRSALTVTALAAAPALTQAADDYKWAWVTAADKNICGGMITDCNDKVSCTTVGVGPCEGSATEPKAYLKSNLVGLALVNEKTYLSNDNDIMVVDASADGYRDNRHDVGYPTDEDKSSEFAYVMSGNFFSKGYAGIASYLVTGAKDIQTNFNMVFAGVDNQETMRVDRSGDSGGLSVSDVGAPRGPFKVCISDYDASATDKCGAPRTFKSGEYKFSIFGHIFEDVDELKDYDHAGFRMKLSTVGFEVQNLKVNGKNYSTATENQNVRSMELVHESGTLVIDFPTKYNVGTTENADSDGVRMMTVTGTHEVKIKVHGASQIDQSVLIDYLFDSSTLGNGKYFIYDPTIKESHTDSSSSSSSSSSGGGSASADSAGSIASIGALAVGATASVVAVFLGSL